MWNVSRKRNKPYLNFFELLKIFILVNKRLGFWQKSSLTKFSIAEPTKIRIIKQWEALNLN